MGERAHELLVVRALIERIEIGAALGAHPRVRLLSSLDPGQTWGLATMALDGMPAAPLVPLLLEKYRIVISAAVSQGLPGPVFPFNGLRVTPQVYTTLGEIDRFVAAVEEILRRSLV